MEERQECSDPCQHRHHLVQLEFEHQEPGDLTQFAVLQDDRDVFDEEYRQVARQAEGHFGQHRMRVRMPEREPCPDRLTDVHHQDEHRAAVADESKDHCAVDHRAQFFAAEDVQQEPCEEGAGAERDDGQIEIDPESEREPVVHVRVEQPLGQTEVDRVETDPEQDHPGSEPGKKVSECKCAANRAV